MKHQPRRPNPRPGQFYMTVPEVADELRVSRMTVYRRIHDGELKAVRIGRGLRVAEKDLSALIERAYGEGESGVTEACG